LFIPKTFFHKHRIAAFSSLFWLILVLSVFALCVGQTWISPLSLWKILVIGENDSVSVALDLVRIPRLLAALGGGACLAVSGALLQRLTRNPLVDPGLLGINSGATLAVVLMLISYSHRNLAPPWILPIAAVAGAFVTAAFIAFLVWGRRSRNPATILLIGVAIGAGTSAIAQSLAVVMDRNLLRWMVAWQTGTLSGVSLTPGIIMLVAVFIGILLAFFLAPQLEVSGLGDDLSMALGVDLERLRRRTLLLAAFLGAIPVAWCGGIVFVGFLAPHMSRMLMGGAARTEFLGAALCGAFLVLATDTFGRTVLPGNELPAGALLGMIGVPVFLISLSRWGGRTFA
jgi:iron complex transport system permease protein